MNFWINFTDYKIKSRKIFLGTVFTYSAILLTTCIGEVLIDLKVTTIDIIVPITFSAIILSILSIRFPDSRLLHFITVIFVFITAELHYLISPATYHVVLYWFTLVPLVALIIYGLRASQLWLGIILITNVSNYFFLNNQIGSYYNIDIYGKPFLIGGSLFVITFMTVSYLLYNLLGNAYHLMHLKNEELKSLNNQIALKKELMEKYQSSIIAISKNKTLFKRSDYSVYEKICKEVVVNLNISQVSIWMLEDNNELLVRQCIHSHEKISKNITTLKKSEFQMYFSAILSQPFIIANNAYDHPHLNELQTSYLIPQNIHAFLECPIRSAGKTIGVIRCEHLHKKRSWTTEDTLFIQSLGDLISLSHKSKQIRTLLDEVSEKNIELSSKNDEISEMNYELSALNEELSTINNSLEETVQSRTKTLADKNKQLTEYAFINSHLLRAPLSRVLGLSHLIAQEVTSHKDQKLISYLVKETEELDEIIRTITDLLDNGNEMTREELNTILGKNIKLSNLEDMI